MTADLSYADAWRAIAAEHGDLTAVVQGDRRFSYAELVARGGRLASAWRQLGIGRDDVVGLYMRNRPEYLECCLAAYTLGALPMNINYRYVGRELTDLVESADARMLIHDSSDVGVLEQVAAARPATTIVAVPGAASGAPDVPYDQLLASGIDEQPPVDRSGPPRLVVYTGGTTGMPKGVLWRHGDAMASAWRPFEPSGISAPADAAGAADVVSRLRRDDLIGAVVVAPPLIHGTGLWGALQALVTGQRVVLLESRQFDPEELAQAIQDHGAWSASIVGDPFGRPLVTALDQALRTGDPYDLSTLRRIVSSGAAWSREVKRGLHRHCRARLVDNLSASEGAGFAVNVTEVGDEPETAEFVLGPGAEVLDQHGRPADPETVGVLAVSGPIPEGYLGDPDRTAQVFRKIHGIRYAVPGDYAVRSHDGSIRLLGRGSVSINSGGEKVYPEEVEEAVKAVLPTIADCLVVGAHDDSRGELVCAVVAMLCGTENADSNTEIDSAARTEAIDSDKLLAHVQAELRSRLAGYKHPRRMVVVPQVRRSPSGKADYAWARSLVADHV